MRQAAFRCVKRVKRFPRNYCLCNAGWRETCNVHLIAFAEHRRVRSTHRATRLRDQYSSTVQLSSTVLRKIDSSEQRMLHVQFALRFGATYI